jgi:ribosomal protein L11
MREMGEKTFRILVEGGGVTAGPPLGPALGP